MPVRSHSPTSSGTSGDNDSLTNDHHTMNYAPMDMGDDQYGVAIPPSSPTSIATADDDFPLSQSDQAKQQLRELVRRPGLGVSEGEASPRDLNGPPIPSEARLALGYVDNRGFAAELVAGETVMLLSRPFYDEVCKWLDSQDDATAAPNLMVDNSDLFELYESVDRPGRMRVGLHHGTDFVLVSSANWELLMDWFGGGPCVSRKCVNDGGRVVVDIRGIELKIKRSSRPTKFMRHVFSIYDTVGTLKRAAVEDWSRSLNIPPSVNYRIWDYFEDKCYTRMHPESAQLAAFKLSDGQSIMFEEPDPVTGEFRWDPETGEDTTAASHNLSTYGPSASSSAFSPSNNFSSQRRRGENSVTSSRRPVVPGAVGLSNLGNTCFMNSTLQCLSNIWLLRNPFVSNDFEQDINVENPLGTGGRLARSFGDLMKLIWGSKGDIVSPAGFKSVMAEFKPEFSGYQQHDSQELLSFLLDGLHEDMNRVKKKPVTNAVEANGRPDYEVAAEAARVHRMRNDSFVNDLFEGFYKSTVVCPDCHHVSVTFDPFTIVQLPVSKPKQAKTVSVPVAVLSGENGLPFRPTPTIIRVATDAYVHEARIMACSNQREDLDADDFIMCSVYHSKVDKVLQDFDKLSGGVLIDELIAFHDPNAKRIRLTQEVYSNGVWHRPIFAPSSSSFELVGNSHLQVKLGNGEVEMQMSEHMLPCPFVKGDVWIGSLDHRKYRLRMQVCETLEFGPWILGLGYRLKCVLDVAAVNTNSYYDRRDGIEEAAFETFGFVRDPAAWNANLASSNVIFDYGRFIGAYGSYIGDCPTFGNDRPTFGLMGNCISSSFFAGQVVESQSSMRYTSMYHQPKAFSMMRLDKDLMKNLPHDLLRFTNHINFPMGPQLPPSSKALAMVALYQKKSYESVGQPAMFSVPINVSPKDLYDILLRRFTARIKSRIRADILTESADPSDPYMLRGMFQVIQRFPAEHTQRVLDEFDDHTLVVVPGATENPVPLVQLTIEWDAVKVSNLEEVLFDNLYQDDGTDPTGKGNTKLYECFDMFSEQEKLSSTETWYCSNCKDHKEAFKKMELWDVPTVLVVHLKRFSQSQSSYFVDKDDTEIDFPLENLDLRTRVRNPQHQDDCVYDLVAVSHHYGGLGGGHYIAHARNEADGKWYEFDDSSVRPLGTSAAAASKVKGESAYVLFYVKRRFTAHHWPNSVTSSPSAVSTHPAVTIFNAMCDEHGFSSPGSSPEPSAEPMSPEDHPAKPPPTHKRLTYDDYRV